MRYCQTFTDSNNMNIKQRLKNKDIVAGSWLNTGSPVVAELMAQCGFDYICVDVEHSAVDLPQTQQLFQAIRSGNQHCAPFVRLHGVDYPFVKRYLDAGAMGVIAPLVVCKEEVETLIRATKYPPLGQRGVGFCRANNYGMNLSQSLKTADDEITLVVQIEHIDAVKNIDEILSVDGVDAAFIGPYDLSASMGIPAQFDHPDYLQAIRNIQQACERHGVASGIHVVKPDTSEVDQRIREGYRLIAYSLDITLLTTYFQQGVDAIKQLKSQI